MRYGSLAQACPERVVEQRCGIAHAYRLAPHACQECRQVRSQRHPLDSGQFWDGGGLAVRAYILMGHVGHGLCLWHLRYVNYLLGSGVYIREGGATAPVTSAWLVMCHLL